MKTFSLCTYICMHSICMMYVYDWLLERPNLTHFLPGRVLRSASWCAWSSLRPLPGCNSASWTDRSGRRWMRSFPHRGSILTRWLFSTRSNTCTLYYRDLALVLSADLTSAPSAAPLACGRSVQQAQTPEISFRHLCCIMNCRKGQGQS